LLCLVHTLALRLEKVLKFIVGGDELAEVRVAGVAGDAIVVQVLDLHHFLVPLVANMAVVALIDHPIAIYLFNQGCLSALTLRNNCLVCVTVVNLHNLN